MKVTATLILLFIYTFGISQISLKDSSYNCIAHWKKGEEKVLLIERNKQSIRSGKAEPPFNFSYEAFITVIDSTDEGYKIQWVFHLPEEVKKAIPGFAEAMPVYEGLKMIFLTNNSGSFKELINWQEVKNAYVKMMEFSLPKNMDDSTKAALEKSNELFNSKEMVESTLIPEIQLYYSPYGAILTMKGRSIPSTFPSPFTDDLIPAIITEKITEISSQTDIVKFVIDQSIDLKNATSLFEGLFKKLNISDDTALVKANELLSQFEIKDQSEYKISPLTGWINKMSHQRIASNFNIRNEDSFLFEMK